MDTSHIRFKDKFLSDKYSVICSITQLIPWTKVDSLFDSYLKPRIIDSFPLILNEKLNQIKTSFVSLRNRRSWPTKLVFILWFFILIFVENFCNTILIQRYLSVSKPYWKQILTFQNYQNQSYRPSMQHPLNYQFPIFPWCANSQRDY